MWRRKWTMLGVGVALLYSAQAFAKPPGTSEFCKVYPQAKACAMGQVACGMCHATPPARNIYGAQLEASLIPGESRPLSDSLFLEGLGEALKSVEGLDADGDGVSNLVEITAGTSPSNDGEVPAVAKFCEESGVKFARYNVCGFDAEYLFRKVNLDFCGSSATFEQVEALRQSKDQKALILSQLEQCFDSEFWRGKNGVVWNLGNAKIEPMLTLKRGEDEKPDTLISFADYYDDYQLFVYVNTDGRDVREVLTAQYFVSRKGADDEGPTEYKAYQQTPLESIRERGFEEAQFVDRSRRAGMLTTRWFLLSNTMFSSMPRTTAAQAYRAYLGMDISKLEGLYPVAAEPVDYDAKGVDAPECAVCHSTLDPLTYPFSRYDGLGGGSGVRGPGRYNPDRMEAFVELEGPQIAQTPEAGVLMGQEVEDLVAWASVAANSREFAQNVVRDYWRVLMGEGPRGDEMVVFESLVESLMTTHKYSVEAMLRQLIFTEVYSVP